MNFDQEFDDSTPLPDEEISDEEQKLANKLQRLCSIFGEEQKSSLSDSADVLLQMGELYLKKARDELIPMRKMLSFIKCCALLNGARVRFKMLKQHEKEESANVVLGKFSDSLFEACDATNNRVSLPHISESIAKELLEMRENSKREFLQIQRNDETENDEKEKLSIMEIQNLYSKITKMYKNLMVKITQNCIGILGDSPCKFCQVGLGSMAREEITLYSDYEHVIILQDDITKNISEYKNAQNYFRWFAVLFQSIIIGLGETFMRSVGVKSINDLYSGDRSKNWYYDVFTPCGISFDGMVPHSCMNPLGRQIATKERKHKVELIQPAKKMANFLTTDAHVKNGYYMKDILTRTCLVYGEKEVYESFCSASQKILHLEDTFVVVKDSFDKIKKNCNEFIRGARMGLYSEEFNAKVTFYRPVTALISYMGRICEVNAMSSFHIIDGLLEQDVITENVAHKIRYALAISCKMRMHAYVIAGNQRHVSSEKVMDALGTNDSWKCYRAIQYLHIALIIIIQAINEQEDWRDQVKQFNIEFFADNDTEDVFKLVEIGEFEEAANLAEKIMDSLNKKRDYLKLCWLLAECYRHLAKKHKDKQEEYFTKLIAICEKVIPDPELPDAPKGDFLYIYAISLKFKGEYELAAHACADFLSLCHSSSVAMKEHEINYPKMLKREIKMRLKYMDPEKLLLYLRALLLVEEKKDTQIIIRFGIAQAEILAGNVPIAKQMLSSLVDIFCDSPRETTSLINTLNSIAHLQESHGWLKDSLVALKCICQNPYIVEVEKMAVDRRILEILIKLERREEGIVHIRNSMTSRSLEKNNDLVQQFQNMRPKGNDNILDIQTRVQDSSKVDIVDDVPMFSEVKEHLANEFRDMPKVLEDMNSAASPVDAVVNMINTLPDDYLKLNNVQYYSTLAKILVVLGQYGYLLLKNNVKALAKLANLMVLEHSQYASSLWKIVLDDEVGSETKNMAIRYFLAYISTHLSSTLIQEKSKKEVEDYLDSAVVEGSDTQLIQIARKCIAVCTDKTDDLEYYNKAYARMLSIVLLRIGISEFDEVMFMLLDAPDAVVNQRTMKKSMLIHFRKMLDVTLTIINIKYDEVSIRRLGVLVDLMSQSLDDDILSVMDQNQERIIRIINKEKSDVEGHLLDLLDKFSENGSLENRKYALVLWKVINSKVHSSRMTKAIYYLINILENDIQK